MNIEEAVGRLIMPAIRAEDATMWDVAADLARDIHAGGFLLFGGDRKTVAGKLAAVRKAAGGRPILIASDLERGAGQQIAGLTRLPHLMAIGASASHDLARKAGLVSAREARAAGIHLIFGPDTDLNTDPANPIINIRAFGDDPIVVGRLAQSWIRGCREGGALSCTKHFPGHGHTAVDSHLALPKLEESLPLLMARELMPFAMTSTGDGAADSVMTAHMAVPSLTGDPDLPVTMSPRAIRYLRGDLGFTGLIFTDALLMGGITAAFDEADAGVRALAAGCDILLCPADPRCLHEVVVKAVRDGKVPEERLRESVARLDKAIAACKADAPAVEGEAAPDSGGAALAEEIASHGLTRVFGDPPSRAADVVALIGGDPGEAGGDLAAEIHRRAPKTALYPVTVESPGERIDIVRGALEAAGRSRKHVAIALFSKILAWKGGSGLPEREAGLVRDICARVPGVTAVSCGSPYLLVHAKGAAFAGCAFSDEPASQRAAAAALVAQAGWPGKPPVSLATVR